MHVARGGWLGQTFALAKFDDSFEGKKSVIRRSKEERKGMVQTFIKRYQKLNNGDFPSLNLTRKEVGGSFYTVREIVREIIQENRVLGPPKLLSGDQNMTNLDSFLEHYPLGSMSVDLHVHSVPLKDTPNLPEYAFMSVSEDEINEQIANQTKKHQILKDTDVLNSTVHDMDAKSSERVESLDGGLEAKDTEKKEIAMENNKHLVCDEIHLFDKSTDVVDIKPTLASDDQSHSSTKENLAVDVNGNTNVNLDNTLLVEEKTVNGANAQNSKATCSSVQQPTVDETSANMKKSSDQPGANSQTRRTNATLNRINLESWKAASKKSNGQETHQLVKFIKAFITAFVKFWSE